MKSKLSHLTLLKLNVSVVPNWNSSETPFQMKYSFIFIFCSNFDSVWKCQYFLRNGNYDFQPALYLLKYNKCLSMGKILGNFFLDINSFRKVSILQPELQVKITKT